ncbi:hypothetical protein [Dactylosporangium sp. NPDC048998]|uniref:hypothetical protein n=1 Tax=Dactylosporangium sp. NPDC048998 TaxID=3363976 RepID=UPI003712118A
MVDLDEHNAGDLLRPLRDDPPRPPAVDVRRAMRDGHRRRTTRRAAIAGAVGLAVLAVAAVPAVLAATGDDRLAPPPGGTSPTGVTPAPPSTSGTVDPLTATPRPISGAGAPRSCRAEKLPAPSGAPKTLVTAADPTGKLIFGLAEYGADVNRVVLWQGNKLSMIDIPGDEPQINSVNEAGTAVGWSMDNGTTTARLYRDGKVTTLPGGTDATAVSINASGAIAGNRGHGGFGPLSHPVVWRDATAPPHELPLPKDAQGGAANDIDDDGTVVGLITIGVQQFPYVWGPDDAGRQLPLPPGTPVSPNGGGKPGPSSTVSHVRNGWAIGSSGAYTPSVRRTRWDLRTGAVQTLPDQDTSLVNARGWLAGTGPDGHAILVAGDKRIQLPHAYPHPQSVLPITISDDAHTITGNSYDQSGDIHPVLWRCS